MRAPRWDSENAARVREELLRRVERGPEPATRLGGGGRPRMVRSVVAAVITLAVIVPAAIFAVTGARSGRIVGAEEPTPSSSRPSVALDPAAALIGLWTVQADGEGDATWVRFSPGSATVERGRLLVFTSWVAAGDRITASVTGFDGRLAHPTVPWLERAATFGLDGTAVVLRGEDDGVLATLRPATEAPLPRGSVAETMNGRTTAAEIAAAFTAPTPPAHPGPAVTAAALAGRWRTGRTDAEGGRPFLTFAADGTYTASDGCNGTSGRWLLSDDNRIAFTGGLRSLTACENQLPVPDWTGAARTVSVQGGRLTLYDRAGKALGSFDRR